MCHSPRTLSDDLDNTAGLLDLLLRERRDESGLDDEWRVDSTLAQLKISLDLRRLDTFTDQLELAESLQVNDGDGTGRSLDLGLGQGDELKSVVTPVTHESRLTLSMLMVGRWYWFLRRW